MIKPKFSIIIAVLAVLVIGVMAYNSPEKQVKEKQIKNTEKLAKIKIANLSVIQGLPLYLAIEKGYFEEVGIEVEAIQFNSPNLIIDALLSGQVDFGSPSTAMGITAISQVRKPESLKIFSLSGTTPGVINDVLITRAENGLETIEDLKNKKLGILPGIQFRTIAKHILEQSGLEDSDVEIVDIAPPLQSQALAQGQVDAVLTLEPIRTIAINKGIAKDLIKSPITKFVSNPTYLGGGVVTTKFMEKYPEQAKKIIAVFDRAIKEINDNPEAARKYLKNYTALDDKLIKEVPLATFTMYQDVDQNDIDALQKFFDIFYEHGVIEEKADTESLIYSPSS